MTIYYTEGCPPVTAEDRRHGLWYITIPPHGKAVVSGVRGRLHRREALPYKTTIIPALTSFLDPTIEVVAVPQATFAEMWDRAEAVEVRTFRGQPVAMFKAEAAN